MNLTGIEWTELTWNPITGCRAGCSYCYARRMAQRLAGRYGYPAEDPFQPILHIDRLVEPDEEKRPRRIFVCSMGEIFGPEIPFEWISTIYSIMDRNQRHRFLLLTKQPQNIPEALQVPPNVWVGVTAETGFELHRWETLRQKANKCGFRGRTFISAEPLLGGISDRIEIKGKPDWIIYGAMSGPKPIKPKTDWMLDWTYNFRGVMTFYKDSMRPHSWDPLRFPNSPLRFHQDIPEALMPRGD